MTQIENKYELIAKSNVVFGALDTYIMELISVREKYIKAQRKEVKDIDTALEESLYIMEVVKEIRKENKLSIDFTEDYD
jgi:hypothetical protein